MSDLQNKSCATVTDFVNNPTGNIPTSFSGNDQGINILTNKLQ